MNLKKYLNNLGSLTKRERKLVIDAWIEASGVFDVGASRADELRNEAVDVGHDGCLSEGHSGSSLICPHPFCVAERMPPS